MMKYRLSHRAKELLLVVDQHTEYDINACLARYFAPRTCMYYTPLSKHGFTISGSGDASVLKSLEKKGLITRPVSAPADYSYYVTEDGRLVAREIERAIQ